MAKDIASMDLLNSLPRTFSREVINFEDSNGISFCVSFVAITYNCISVLVE
jgi:hypothetical protein